METNKVDIVKGLTVEEAANICIELKLEKQKNVRFELNYGCRRTAWVDILEIKEITEEYVKMKGSMPVGFFIYSQGEDPRPDREKLKRIEVYIFCTFSTGKGYIEKAI